MHHAEVPVSSHREKLSSSLRISTLFAVANGRQDASEVERLEAVNELLREFRLQCEQYRQKEINSIDRLLVQGIKNWSFRIFIQPDPMVALARFLGKKQPPGKRAKDADRNFAIAKAVHKKMQAGMNLENATDATQAEYPSLNADTIKKIYVRSHKMVQSHNLEVQAHLAMCALEGGRYLPAPPSITKRAKK
jgi:hypothetical protein